MNKSYLRFGRKAAVLSATFLASFFLTVACKKKDYNLGTEGIDSGELLNSEVKDTFSLQTFTIKQDSVITDNAAYSLLGSYNDPDFGTMKSGIYTQLRLSGLNPNFGDENQIIVDSFVVGLQYAGFYGKSGIQTLEAYELTEKMSLDSTYYSFSNLSYAASNLIPAGKENINFDSDNVTVIGSDTVASQLRIHLDTNLAKQFISDANAGNPAFSSNDNFLDYFKGLYLTTNNGAQASGEGGIGYFDLNAALSKATIYYRLAGDAKRFDLNINIDCADFNHIDVDNSGKNIQTVINDTISGQTTFYAQATSSRAVVKIPGLKNIPKNAVVHTATLELPIAYQFGSKYTPSDVVNVFPNLENSDPYRLALLTTGSLNAATNTYEIDIRAYVQTYLLGELSNDELLVSPRFFVTSAERIIFNGQNTTNKKAPKLKVTYTLF